MSHYVPPFLWPTYVPGWLCPRSVSTEFSAQDWWNPSRRFGRSEQAVQGTSDVTSDVTSVATVAGIEKPIFGWFWMILDDTSTWVFHPKSSKNIQKHREIAAQIQRSLWLCGAWPQRCWEFLRPAGHVFWRSRISDPVIKLRHDLWVLNWGLKRSEKSWILVANAASKLLADVGFRSLWKP